ncbi:MAG TPA: hypothetical protein VK435_06250 [Thermodesulfovibrionales bacterium]|nr:hypothetical protein [Thermodesulfovibrionales bacterium]
MGIKPFRKSGIFLCFIAVSLLLVSVMFVYAFFRVRSDAGTIIRQSEIVKELQLTDLCLFTEARYTRNPSQADLHAAFQDHPVSIEHFPAGSLVMPPECLRRINGKVN